MTHARALIFFVFVSPLVACGPAAVNHANTGRATADDVTSYAISDRLAVTVDMVSSGMVAYAPDLVARQRWSVRLSGDGAEIDYLAISRDGDSYVETTKLDAAELTALRREIGALRLVEGQVVMDAGLTTLTLNDGYGRNVTYDMESTEFARPVVANGAAILAVLLKSRPAMSTLPLKSDQ